MLLLLQVSFSGAPQVLLRRWTLAEVVTAVAEAGLTLAGLEEEQGVKKDDKGELASATHTG